MPEPLPFRWLRRAPQPSICCSARSANPDTQCSLGTFGALAEFARDRDEPVHASARVAGNGVSAGARRVARGIALTTSYRRAGPSHPKSITRTGWSQRIALCLPERMIAPCTERAVADRDSAPIAQAPARAGPRQPCLFDLGLGALQGGLRRPHRQITATSPPNCAVARAAAVFEPGNPAHGHHPPSQPAPGLHQPARPHRGVSTDPARVGKSPEGPHTHVLPKLLKSGRSHPATEPVPDGC